LVLGQATFSDQ